jgi:hypothetical protein
MTKLINQLLKDLSYRPNESNSGADEMSCEKWYCPTTKTWFLSKKEARAYYKDNLIEHVIKNVQKDFGGEDITINRNGKIEATKNDNRVFAGWSQDYL